MENFKPNHVYAFNKFLQAAQSGHVESAWHIVNYYLNGIERALPKVRKDGMAWAQYIINTIDPEISKSIKYAIEMRLKNKYCHAVVLYRNGFLLAQRSKFKLPVFSGALFTLRIHEYTEA